MSELSRVALAEPSPRVSVVTERLRKSKREAVEQAVGKGEGWVAKLLSGESGVRLEDMPVLLAFLELKVVDRKKVCVDPEIAHAYDVIVRKKIEATSLLFEDAE